MRILICSPSILPSISGNAITVERWKRGLAGRGNAVETISSQSCTPDDFATFLRQFCPDIIHVHHAFRAGTILLNPAIRALRANLAVVASPGGTDINVDFGRPDRRDAVAEVFGMAAAIIVQSEETAARLRRQMPDLSEKLTLVPKASCWFGDDTCDLRRIAGCSDRSVLFFLPAGIRPVKGNLECLLAMEKVHAIRPELRFVSAGPQIESEYGSRFVREMSRLSSFALWIDSIPLAAMRSAYEASDVVLNSSYSEGLSNSLLEALASGCPILASDIPGNWWPVRGISGDEPAGLLYALSDTGDFVANAVRLIDDENLRLRLSHASRLRASRLPSPEDEADGLIGAYEKAFARGCGKF